MTIKRRILTLLLAVMLLALPLISCNDDEPAPETPSTDDEFTGSIVGDGDGGSEDDTTESDDGYTLAEGDENATVYITSYDDLKSKITQKGKFILQNDIVIEAADFIPIGSYVYPFLGTFDGNGHKITVTVNQSAEGIGFSSTFKFVYCGFFGVTRDATITNLELDITAKATSSTEKCFVLSGGIAGYMINTKVSGCKVSGTVSAKSEFFNAYAGNIAGVIQGGEVEDCASLAATVSAVDSENRAEAGGIAGYIIEGTAVSGCNISGSVTSVSTKGIAYVGGLVGNAKRSSFTACSVNAPVSGTVSKYTATDKTHGVTFAGGIVGVASGDSTSKKAEFTRCYILDTTVTLAGNNTTAFAGGIAANVNYGSFVHCYSLADITFSSGMNIGAAGSAFGSLDSSVTESADKTSYLSDFIINGCFASGDVSVTHNKNTQYMFYGTSYGYIISDSAKNNITYLFYNKDATFTFNGSPFKDSDKNGKGENAAFFTLENCVTYLYWNSEQWQTVGGVITAK